MKQWNFYFSGILYGIIRDQNEDGKELNHQTLDVFTNTFNREEPFHNDDFYAASSNRFRNTRPIPGREKSVSPRQRGRSLPAG